MELTITVKNLTLTDALEDYAQKRLARLDRRLRKTVPVRLILKHEDTRSVDSRYVAEVTAALMGGVDIRGEERAANINAAIDGVADTIVRQIDRYKTRRIRSKRDGQGISEFEQSIASSLAAETETAGGATVGAAAGRGDTGRTGQGVVRVKRHQVSPMTVEQAAAQMDLLGHTFFVFQNVEDDSINVVYRRNDGDYGLIVPVSS
ncbi:MAG: ribosome-associated translation inhibitor RaiA [Chloroflexi bacterium]|nr:ribosome-associated translation inhibitor RaiA [Chloroflexota bacterium]